MTLRSLSANSPGRRANWRALGLSKEDMEKPKIAVVNSSSELAICYAHLDGIAAILGFSMSSLLRPSARQLARRPGELAARLRKVAIAISYSAGWATGTGSPSPAFSFPA